MSKFFKSNWVYLLWFVVYFFIAWVLLGATSGSFIFVAIFYAISISIALSSFGEWLLRAFENVRGLETAEEREYLEPIFEEVYANAKEENPKLNDDIQLHIIDAMYVNAFAIGRKTIAVTTGAVETFTEEELKGVIAHEFGHITYGHTKALLLSIIGNMLFSLLVLIVRFSVFICEFLATIFTRTSMSVAITSLLVFISKATLNISIMLFMYLGQVILSLNSRYNEYEADEFAFKIGFGEELISALYLLKKISGTQKASIRERMTSSHPHIASRISTLENMEEVGE